MTKAGSDRLSLGTFPRFEGLHYCPMAAQDSPQEDFVESKSLKWVHTGRDFWTGSLFGHLIFLNTHFPERWPHEFMKVLRHIHPKNFYDTEQDLGGDTEAQRIRACFHGMKYMLGLFEWDSEKKATIEAFPACYDLPVPNDEEEHKLITVLFKQAVFPKLWYIFTTTDEEDKIVILNMELVEVTKEAIQGKRIGIFTDVQKNMVDPYAEGIHFQFLEEMKVPADTNKKCYMRLLDIVGFILCLDYAPMGHPGARHIPKEDIAKPETIELISKLSFKHGIHNTFNGHHSCVWTLAKNKLDGFIRPDAVARTMTSKTNGIHMYAALLQKIKDLPSVIATDVRDKLEEVGFLNPAILEKDFGRIKKTRKRVAAKKGDRIKTPQTLTKVASTPRSGAPSPEEPMTDSRKRMRNPFLGPKRNELPVVEMQPPAREPETYTIPTTPTPYQDPDVLCPPESPEKKLKIELPPPLQDQTKAPVVGWDNGCDAFFD